MKINYSYLDLILHRVFLGNSQLSQFLYERLTRSSPIRDFDKNSRHIFITGLARSGTTSLLNKIYSSGEIGSILYKHMPFILSPTIANFYSSYFKNKNNKYIERYHDDGIMISNNSPECLDEVFWMKSFPNLEKLNYIFCPKINENILSSYSYLLEKYSLINKKERLVIKNNNHHIRLSYLTNFFVNSYFLLLIRDPLSHALSLLNQHIKFTKIHSSNSAVLEYMNLIGHNEFGIGIKPFVYSENQKNWYGELDKFKLSYWLKQWINTYEWFLSSSIHKRDNVTVMVYEKICEDSSTYSRLCDLVEIKENKSSGKFISSNYKYFNKKLNVEPELIVKAKEIYSNFKELSF